MDAMLWAVRAEGGLKRGEGLISASAFLIPKNEVKCRLILNLVRLNREIEMRPPKFRLPQIEELPSRLGGLPARAQPFSLR